MAVPGTDGEKYFSPEERMNSSKSIVWFTRDLSANGLKKVYSQIVNIFIGRMAIKLHTGEPDGPNIIKPEWVKDLINDKKLDATIVETNTLYGTERKTTQKHRATIKRNGWTFCPVDILDEFGVTNLPVKGGKWFDHMSVGRGIINYDCLLVLTHFKSHPMAGFGGSAKNIGIGCADGKIGKAMIHNRKKELDIEKEELCERFIESAKSIVDYFGNRIGYINVMNNMSVDCDCTGVNAAPVVTPDVGILASLDILAIDQACVDLIYAMLDEDSKALRERMESRHGLRQLTYMKELGMGNPSYKLIDLDDPNKSEITPQQAVTHIKPYKREI